MWEPYSFSDIYQICVQHFLLVSSYVAHMYTSFIYPSKIFGTHSIYSLFGGHICFDIFSNTGGSCLSHTAVKPDSHLAQIFVAKFLCIIRLIIIIG